MTGGRASIAHDYDGTDEGFLWQAIAEQFPAIVAALAPQEPEHG